MPYNSDLLNVIDYRIAQNSEHITAMGTVTYRTTSYLDNTAMVTFDGSNLAVPVKMFGNCRARPGDRVGLVKFGSEWVALGSFSWPRLGEAGFTSGGGTPGSVTPVSFTDTPDSGNVCTFTKYWDETEVQGFVLTSAYAATTGSTSVAYGMKFVEIATTYNLAFFYFNDAGKHHTVAGGQPGVSGIPAGTHTVRLQWLRSGGTGVPNMDGSDWCLFAVREIAPRG